MRRGGFSLTELLVAVFILAVGSVQVARIFHNNARLITAEAETAGMIEQAEGLLATAILDPSVDADTRLDGSDGLWLWSIEGKLYEPFKEEKELKPEGRGEFRFPPHRLVELTVTVSNRDGIRSFQLTGLTHRSGITLSGAP